MEKEFANYDMFDRLIANEKKAKSWTVLWVTLLCLMATAIIWLALSIADVKKENAALQLKNDAHDSAKARERLIYDSAIARCTREKEALIDTFTLALNKLTPGNNQQSSINILKQNLVQIKTDEKKVKPRIFIQYNNADNSKEIGFLSYSLKEKDEYYVAPAELVDMRFTTVIKVYDFKNNAETNRIRSVISRIFRISAQSIEIKPLSNSSVKKPTIEIWINGRRDIRAAAAS